ncbi:MAG: hypothetical protein DIU69_07300 [Bacillota bacterium]|nr:MAG: hypothetical protein DIU69_07300 [Bacillota bacterium]
MALFLRRIARAGSVPGPGHPGGEEGPGPYRPLCRTRACHYNRDWICCYDRVEPAPVAVMEASFCPHALFLDHQEP